MNLNYSGFHSNQVHRIFFQFPIPDSRFPIPDSRLPTPDSRFPTPDSRFPRRTSPTTL
ncbi:hypothetical protein [Moorena bouillonii]|uniref:hypothetical protein n=1 Tax=Moorena bouillonii TaxID=207920 RepID=UPI001301782B|nr:hypothetical protein [Moorena bouillonii]